MDEDQLNDRLVTGAAFWNVYLLPALVLLAVVLDRRWPREGVGGVAARLGLVHYALAAWSLTTVGAELWAYRAMGIFPSNPITGACGSGVLLAFDLAAGFGLRKLRRWGRWWAVVLAAYRTFVGLLVGAWLWQYAPRLDLTEWPRAALYWALPPFALAVLARRSAAGAFGPGAEAGPGPGGKGVAATVALGFLVVAVSAAATDALDWAARAAFEIGRG